MNPGNMSKMFFDDRTIVSTGYRNMFSITLNNRYYSSPCNGNVISLTVYNDTNFLLEDWNKTDFLFQESCNATRHYWDLTRTSFDLVANVAPSYWNTENMFISNWKNTLYYVMFNTEPWRSTLDFDCSNTSPTNCSTTWTSRSTTSNCVFSFDGATWRTDTGTRC